MMNLTQIARYVIQFKTIYLFNLTIAKINCYIVKKQEIAKLQLNRQSEQGRGSKIERRKGNRNKR